MSRRFDMTVEALPTLAKQTNDTSGELIALVRQFATVADPVLRTMPGEAGKQFFTFKTNVDDIAVQMSNALTVINQGQVDLHGAIGVGVEGLVSNAASIEGQATYDAARFH